MVLASCSFTGPRAVAGKREMPGLGGGNILGPQSFRHCLGCPSGLALGSSGVHSMPGVRAEMAYHSQQVHYRTGLSPDCHPGTLRHFVPLCLCALCHLRIGLERINWGIYITCEFLKMFRNFLVICTMP